MQEQSLSEVEAAEKKIVETPTRKMDVEDEEVTEVILR